MLYSNKEKTLNYLGTPALIAGAVNNQELNSATKIIQDFENPKLPSEKSHVSDKKMQPVSPKAWKRLIGQLQKTGLAQNVITDKAKMREYLGKNQEARKQSVPVVEDATEEQIQVNGNWYSRTVYPGWEALEVGDEVPGLNTERKQAKEQTPVDSQLIEAAKNEFGTTNNFNEAGYLLPDGTMLDFSGKKKGARGGYRTEDHREISNIGDDVDMVSFMAMGNIRLKPEAGGFELTGLPTAAQKRTLRRYIHSFGGDVVIDFSTPSDYNTEHSVEYYEAKTERVINDIINYYENGVKPVTGLRLMSTPKGEVYGFVTPEGDVYLDPDKMNANTPIHEFGHLWNSFIKENNPELWNKGAKLIKNSPYWEKVNNNPAYANLTEEQKIDEALAMAIGDKGEMVMQSKNILSMAGLKSWLREVWDWIGSRLGIRGLNAQQIESLTLEQFTSGAVADLMSGEKILPSQGQDSDSRQYANAKGYDFDVSGITEANAKEMKAIKDEAVKNGIFMKAPNGKPTKLNERQWLQVRTKPFLDWFGNWQKQAQINKLRESTPIEITGEEITPSENLKEYRKNANDYGLSLRDTYTNKDTGKRILLGKNGVKEVTSHDLSKEQLQSVAAIPRIIESGIYVDTLPNEDKTKNSDVESYDYYVAGLKIGGVDYTVRSAIIMITNLRR